MTPNNGVGMDEVIQEIKHENDELVELRRGFHADPELGFKEYRTSQRVARYLRDCGIEVQTGIAGTGVVGLIHGDAPGKTVMLRSDMDALPITEETGLPFASENEGVMHACGHDGHMAMLLVAATVLSRHRDRIRGTVKLVFQPNEEDAGAEPMVEAGVLAAPHVDAAFGIHLWSPLSTGTIGLADGPIMASSYYFTLEIKGEGGHGGAPHLGTDTIATATNIMQNVQNIQTRRFDAIYEPTYKFGNKLLANDPAMTDLVKKTVETYPGDGLEIDTQIKVMLGEDFAEFSLQVPSAFYFVGTANSEAGSPYPHHHPRFTIDEASLSIGAALHVQTAPAFLNADE
jgi:amidohydrolase